MTELEEYLTEQLALAYYELNEQDLEINRHHEHFEKISEILDEFFGNPLYINSYYALESLKKIRNIVG